MSKSIVFPKYAIIELSDKQQTAIALHQALISCGIPKQSKIKTPKK